MVGNSPVDIVIYAVVVIRIHDGRRANLFQIVQTSRLLPLGFGFAKRRQEQSGKYGNDGDDDQQLDECETPLSATTGLVNGRTIHK